MLPALPCSQGGAAHWLVGHYGRWEADDNQGNDRCFTHHRVWIDYPCPQPGSTPPAPTEFAGVGILFRGRTNTITCPPGLVIAEFTEIGEGGGWPLLHAQPCDSGADAFASGVTLGSILPPHARLACPAAVEVFQCKSWPQPLGLDPFPSCIGRPSCAVFVGESYWSDSMRDRCYSKPGAAYRLRANYRRELRLGELLHGSTGC